MRQQSASLVAEEVFSEEMQVEQGSTKEECLVDILQNMKSADRYLEEPVRSSEEKPGFLLSLHPCTGIRPGLNER